MKNIRQIFFSIIFLFNGITILFAQKIYFRSFTTFNEISSTNIRKILQDKYGFIWVATQEGVNRFDGQYYTIYSKNALGEKILKDIDAQDIIEDTAANLIWILHGSNISAINYNNGNVVKRSKAYLITNGDLNQRFCLVGNEIWIISHSGVKVYDKLKDNFKTVFKIPSSYKQDIDSYKNQIFTCGSTSVIAVINGSGIFTINRITKRISRLEINPIHNGFSYVKDYSVVKSDIFLIATDNAVFTVSIYQQSILINEILNVSKPKFKVQNKSLFPDTEILQSLVKSNDSTFLVLSNKKIYTLQRVEATWSIAGVFEYINEKVGQTITCALQDEKQNIWIGYEDGLALGKLKPLSFVAALLAGYEQIKTQHVNCVLPCTSDEVLAGLAHGLVKVNLQKGKMDTIETSDTYYHIFKGPENNTFVCGSNQLSIFQGNTLQPVQSLFPELSPYSSFPIIASTYRGNSTMVLATENGNGVLLWNYQQHTAQKIDTLSKRIRLTENFINTVYTDSDKRVWVLSDHSITILNLDSSTINLAYSDKTTGDAFSYYFDIIEHAGYYWLAVYGTGILQLNKKFQIVHTYGLEQGLCNIGVYKLYADSGRIFYTTNKGLGFINIKDKKIYNFYKADGLHGDNFEEASFYAGNRTFYAGGNGGFTQVFPQNIYVNTTKSLLYICEVKTIAGRQEADSFMINLASYRLPPNVQQLTVFFSALNYLNPDRVKYFYRIKENNNNWTGLNNIPSLNLYRFPPGTYTLQVKATNEAGVESDIKELKLIFLPKWYETIWLKIGVVLALAAIFYTLYRYRLSQLKAREAIRRKIASDLHDDLGSTLTSVRIFTDLAIRQNPKDFLLQIKQGIQDAMTATRDMIWIMDRTRNNAAQLVEKINSFALPLTKANNIHFEFQAGKSLEDVILKADEQRDLYLIVKEFITNSLKYAGCKKISVGMDKHGKRITITISDDGKGFDLNTVKRGKGITNMLARAAAIRYIATFNSSVNGTILQIMPGRKRFWVA